jgi:hypothetical protein
MDECLSRGRRVVLCLSTLMIRCHGYWVIHGKILSDKEFRSIDCCDGYTCTPGCGAPLRGLTYGYGPNLISAPVIVVSVAVPTLMRPPA